MSARVLFCLAFLAALPLRGEVLSADEILARVRAAYARDTYHDKAVIRRSFNGFVENTETFFSKTDGLKFTDASIAPPDMPAPSRTVVYWGAPDCLHSYRVEHSERSGNCTEVCSQSFELLPLKIVCHFVVGHALWPRFGINPSRRVENRLLGGRQTYVIIDVGDYGPQTELWVDPVSFEVRRLVLLQPNLNTTVATTVDFLTVERGVPMSRDVFHYRPPFTLAGFTQEHRWIAQFLFLIVVFMVSTAAWTMSYYLTEPSAEDRLDAQRRRWRVWGIATVIGYGVVLLMGVMLSFVGGGHPPPVVIAIIAAFTWTFLVILAAIVFAGSTIADFLIRRYTRLDA